MRLRFVDPLHGQFESRRCRAFVLPGQGEPVVGRLEPLLDLADDPLALADLAIGLLDRLQIPRGVVGTNLMRAEREREA